MAPGKESFTFGKGAGVEFIRLLLSERNVIMQYEMAAMALLLLLPFFLVKDRKRLALIWGVVFLFFIYIHRVLLPFIVSGIYFFVLSGIIAAVVELKPSGFLRPARTFAAVWAEHMEDGMLPFMAVIILVFLVQLCRLNISLDYDSLRYGLRSDVLLTDSGLGGFFRSLGLVNTVYTYPKGFELITWPLSFSNTCGYVLCFNIWVLAAILTVTGDIASEVLGAELKAYDGGVCGSAAVLAAAAAALVPGITNMAITAKPDLITLLCQLVFVLCVVRYLNNSDSTLTGVGTGALILSYSFKPTAIVFSSVLGLTAIVYFVIRKIRPVFDLRGIRALIMAAVFTAVITARTWLITGMPFTSVFTGLLTRLGFELKYPFRAQSISAIGNDKDALESIQFYLSRVVHFFFCPTGEDMEHVQMAWGGLIFTVLLIVSFLLLKRTLANLDELRRLGSIRGGADRADEAGRARVSSDPGNRQAGRDSHADIRMVPCTAGASEETLAAGFCFAALSVMTVMSLISLWMLSQVDGNYFMLLYSLAVICGCTALLTQLGYERSGLWHGRHRLLDGGSPRTVIVLAVVMIYFTAFTSWAGANGFTPVDFINRGYYDHTAVYGDDDFRSYFSIRNPLGWDRHTRVVAFAAEPDCYRIKGRIESWVDIDGSGGNPMLTDTKLDIFKQYLAWADIDYIYADITFLNDDTSERHLRARTLFGYLLEDAVFEEVVFGENSSREIYCRIDKERAAVSWEEPMTAEQESRTAWQLDFLAPFITFGES